MIDPAISSGDFVRLSNSGLQVVETLRVKVRDIWRKVFERLNQEPPHRLRAYKERYTRDLEKLRANDKVTWMTPLLRQRAIEERDMAQKLRNGGT